MRQFRFEITNEENGKGILTVHCLIGDFATGVIKNVAFEFGNYEDFQRVLNIAVKSLSGE